MHKISILIQTRNEEKNIRFALESCAWAHQVFVVDNYSDDTTIQIAKEFENVTVEQREFDGYAKQKNWALGHLPFTGDWIFILDADEQITSELGYELRSIASNTGSVECWYVNRRFIFLGRWIKHAGWYPSWNLRFFKKGMARYEERSVDEHMIAGGRVGYLRNDLIHHDRKGLAAWIEKHNRYSTLEAQEQLKNPPVSVFQSFRVSVFARHPIERKRALKRIFYCLPARPFSRFIVMYVFQCGFLDGYQGFIFCMLRAIQEFHISIKLHELKRNV